MDRKKEGRGMKYGKEGRGIQFIHHGCAGRLHSPE